MNTNYEQIGTADYKRGVLTVDSPMFYRFIDAGLHQHVFKSMSNPLKVLKVYTAGIFTSVLEIKEFNKQWMLRNEFPLHEKVHFEGYLQGDNRVFPVYSQNRITPAEISIETWNKKLLPQINAQIGELGYTVNGTNGKLAVGDIDLWNVGYSQNGELRIFSVDVYEV